MDLLKRRRDRAVVGIVPQARSGSFSATRSGRRLGVSVVVVAAVALAYACGGGAAHVVTTPTSHRAVAPPPCHSQPIAAGTCTGPSGTPPCSTSSDCSAGLDGSCVAILSQGGCSCTYDACLTDDDCGAGSNCACNGRYHGGAGYSGTDSTTACVPANCRVDIDCGPGGFCSPSAAGLCGAVTGFYCHTARDECGNDSDCKGSVDACVWSPEVGHWVCGASGGGCGGG